MRTTAVRSRLRLMASSKAAMWWGRNRWQMARMAVTFSLRSVMISAVPTAVADLYCSVKLPSFGPTVGVHRDTAERNTVGQ